MNLDRCESFIREVQAIYGQYVRMQGEQDQMNGFMRLAQEQGNMDQVRKIDEQRKLIKDALGATERVLLERTMRSSIDAIREYITDFVSRLQLASQEFERWRMAKVELEFKLVAEDGVDRAEAQRLVDVYKRRYEQCVQLAADSVPEKPVILIP